MIFGKSKLQIQIDNLKREFEYVKDQQRDQHWRLYHKHEALVKSLGLKQVDVPAKTEFVKERKAS